MITKLELKLHTNSGFSFGSSYYDSIIFLEILLWQKKKKSLPGAPRALSKLNKRPHFFSQVSVMFSLVFCPVI